MKKKTKEENRNESWKIVSLDVKSILGKGENEIKEVGLELLAITEQRKGAKVTEEGNSHVLTYSGENTENKLMDAQYIRGL